MGSGAPDSTGDFHHLGLQLRPSHSPRIVSSNPGQTNGYIFWTEDSMRPSKANRTSSTNTWKIAKI